MKAKCFNCGKESDWEKEEDLRICEYCNGTGNDEVHERCIFCEGTGIVDLNEDEIPTCEECLLLQDYEDKKY